MHYVRMTIPLDFRYVFREERARLEEPFGAVSVEKEAFSS